MLIDMQGYFSEEIAFIFKELSILHIEPFEEINYKFRAPFKIDNLSSSSMRNVRWVSQYHHGLSWHEGEVQYSNLRSILFSHLERYTSQVTIYIKGAEKKTWLQKIIGEDKDMYKFSELGELGCPSLSELKNLYEADKCSTHSGSIYTCATENVRVLYEWLKSDQARVVGSTLTV